MNLSRSTSVLMRSWVVVWIALGAARLAIAGPIVCGEVVDGEVWNLDDSPVLVNCHVTIASLTIEKGVEVIFTGDYRFEVSGVVRVMGEPDLPVVFKPSEGNATGWRGIRFTDALPGSEFHYAHIVGANESAMRLERSSPVLDHVTFRSNKGTTGGAVLIENSQVMVSTCLFENNYASNAGGAIYTTRPPGQEASRLEVEASVFVGNTVGTTTTDTTHDTFGGAIAIIGNARIHGCTFIANEARGYTIFTRPGRYAMGGALYTAEGHTEVETSSFLGNGSNLGAHSHTPDPSHVYGGAIFQSSGSLTLNNCIVAENFLRTVRWGDHRGGGLYVAGGTSSLTNCSFVSNQNVAVYHESGTVSIENSILFFNQSSDLPQVAGNPAINFCAVQNGPEGNGNIRVNPVFSKRYSLASTSLAIDAGNPDEKHNDVIPPGKGELRNDQGYTGGPRAGHWNEPFWFRDADADGFGDEKLFACLRERPSGFVANGGDCDDTNPAIFPGVESCPGGKPKAERFLRGDVDNSGGLSLSDAVVLLNHLFLGQAKPSCLEAENTDNDGQVTLTDAVYLLSFLFLGGKEPPAPYPQCGSDAQDGDAIDCAQPQECSDL